MDLVLSILGLLFSLGAIYLSVVTYRHQLRIDELAHRRTLACSFHIIVRKEHTNHLDDIRESLHDLATSSLATGNGIVAWTQLVVVVTNTCEHPVELFEVFVGCEKEAHKNILDRTIDGDVRFPATIGPGESKWFVVPKALVDKPSFNEMQPFARTMDFAFYGKVCDPKLLERLNPPGLSGGHLNKSIRTGKQTPL